MISPKELCGLFGGTFDPIHFGHLSAAWQITQSIPEMARIEFIVNQTPPHKQEKITPAVHRQAMVALATRDIREFSVNDCELRRAGPSYTVDTVQHLAEELSGQHLCLIIGQDAYYSFHNWYKWQDILEFVHLIVVARPTPDNELTSPHPELYQREVNSYQTMMHEKAGCVWVFNALQLDISATQIRRQFGKLLQPRFLMPQAVIDYIEQHRIYHLRGD